MARRKKINRTRRAADKAKSPSPMTAELFQGLAERWVSRVAAKRRWSDLPHYGIEDALQDAAVKMLQDRILGASSRPPKQDDHGQRSPPAQNAPREADPALNHDVVARAVHLAIQAMRKQYRRVERKRMSQLDFEAAQVQDPESPWEVAEFWQRVSLQLAPDPEHKKLLCLILSSMEFTHREIGLVLGESPNAVSQRLNRVRDLLDARSGFNGNEA